MQRGTPLARAVAGVERVQRGTEDVVRAGRRGRMPGAGLGHGGVAACEERTSSPLTICLSRNLGGEALLLARQRTRCGHSLAASVLPCFTLFPLRKWFFVLECGRGCEGGHSPSWPHVRAACHCFSMVSTVICQDDAWSPS